MITKSQIKLRKLNHKFNAYIETNTNEIVKLEKRNKELIRSIRETENKLKQQKDLIENNQKNITLKLLDQSSFQSQNKRELHEKQEEEDKRLEISLLKCENMNLSNKHQAIIQKTNEVIEKYNTLLDILTNPQYNVN